MTKALTRVRFGEFLRPNSRPYTLGPAEDANLVGMRLYGAGPFHRELKLGAHIAKKTHFVVRTGDVIYNKLFAWKGTFGVVPPSLEGMLVSDKFPTYALDETVVDPQYLQWFFRCPPLWEQARAMSTGSAAVSKLTLNPPKFLLLEIPLPTSLEEQRQVVSHLNGLAAQIAEARGLRERAIRGRDALMASALESRLRSIPVTARLAHYLVAPPRNGWSPRCDNTEGGTAVLSLGAVTGFRYRATEFKRTSLPVREEAHYWLRPGDLLITRSNTPDLVGHAAIYSGTPNPCIYPDLMMKLQVREQDADPRFVWYWLQSSVVREFVARNAKGTSPTMKKISQRIVSQIPFPVLSLAEQQRIVSELDTLQTQADQLKRLQEETGTELDALMPSLLSRAFGGEP